MPSYTLNELIEKMEPQARQDKAVISRCLDGLGLYAAQIATENRNAPKIDELRTLVDKMAGYWGLDAEPNADRDFLQSFDDKVGEAKTGGAVIGDVFQTAPNVIFGLYRYGEDMAVGQGASAMGDILNVSVLMRDIAEAWDFEEGVLNDLTARLEADVRELLENTPLPGQPISCVVNAGYEITQAIMFENGLGIVLAHHPHAPAPFVTWRFGVDDDGGKWYEWGHYYGEEDRAKIDYINRVGEYMELYGVKEVPFPTTAFEIAAEQNYNMIDGVKNNEGEPKPDLTDGQTHAEVRELAPETLPENREQGEGGEKPQLTAEDFSDPTVSKTDMYAFGYGWDGMIPLGKERALELFDKGCEVFRLHESDAEGVAESRADIETFDGMFGTEDPAWNREADEPSFEVFILNREKYGNGEAVGEWVALPILPGDLMDVFKRIDIDRPSEGAFTITALRVPEYIRDHVSKYDSLDELNMLASDMSGRADFEIDKLKAILSTCVADIGSGTAALINVLDNTNFDAFDLIDANDAESLARYYDRENDEKPEDVSFEEYGQYCLKEEGGAFTEWGYVKFINKELSPEYTGVVPDEYEVTRMALQGLRNAQKRAAKEEKPSVLAKIRSAQKNPAPRRPKKDAPDKAKRKSEEEL